VARATDCDWLQFLYLGATSGHGYGLRASAPIAAIPAFRKLAISMAKMPRLTTMRVIGSQRISTNCLAAVAVACSEEMDKFSFSSLPGG
jgi:hypothetical protein